MCDDCLSATKRISHGFRDCPGCKARAVARSPRFCASVKGGVQTPEYRRMLDQVGVTHDQVKAAAYADRACDRLLRVGAV